MTFDPIKVDTSGETEISAPRSVCDIARELKSRIEGLATRLNQSDCKEVQEVLGYIQINDRGADYVVQIVYPKDVPERDQEGYFLTQTRQDLASGSAHFRRKGHDSDGPYVKRGDIFNLEAELLMEVDRMLSARSFLLELEKGSIQRVPRHVLGADPEA